MKKNKKDQQILEEAKKSIEFDENQPKIKKTEDKKSAKLNHVLIKRDELNKNHKKEKNDLSFEYKKLKINQKKEYDEKLQAVKKTKNIKDTLQIKEQRKIAVKEARKDFKTKKADLKEKHFTEKNNLKLEMIDFKNPIGTVKKDEARSSSLLIEKQKQKKNKLLTEKEKKDYKTIFKNIPIRIFKEIRRIRWGSNDVQIGIKFIQVLILIIICALFIFGVEEALSAILKLMKISTF